MEYQISAQETLYDGFFSMHAFTVEHDCFDGSRHRVRREMMERGDAAALLLYDPKVDEVLLLEQFRIGPAVRGEDAWLTEIVAGIVDDGETTEEAVRRECLEEAGYQPEAVRFLGRYYSTPGGCSERIDLFLALVDKARPTADGGGIDHEHEDIRRFWVPRATALAMLAAGQINSGAPMLAMLLAFGWPGQIGPGASA